MIVKALDNLKVISVENGDVIMSISKGEMLKTISKQEIKRNINFAERKKVERKKEIFMKSFMEYDKWLVKQLDNYPKTYLFLRKLLWYIKPNENILVTNEKRLTGSQLARDLGLSKQCVAFHLNKLIELGAVARIDCYLGKAIAINPKYAINGKYVLDVVDKKFKEIDLELKTKGKI